VKSNAETHKQTFLQAHGIPSSNRACSDSGCHLEFHLTAARIFKLLGALRFATARHVFRGNTVCKRPESEEKDISWKQTFHFTEQKNGRFCYISV